MDTDPFPTSEFDDWAASYDQSTRSETIFPFDGYQQALQAVVKQAYPRPGLKVLDIGTGTGNLAALFAGQGCELWCTDFSENMLALARKKLPSAQFALHDLRQPLRQDFGGPFDAIVSAYVFHHFPSAEKIRLCKSLLLRHLAPGGRLVIADISFDNQIAMQHFASQVSELWDEEFYWHAEEDLAAFRTAGLRIRYEKISACAGVYTLVK